MFLHLNGNNYEAVKTQRVNINIDALNRPVESRYYLPDIPELNKKKIVGIACHVRYNSNPLNLHDGDVNGVAENGFTYWGGGDNTPLYSFLNMIDVNKNKVIENFPCYTLFNAADVTGKANPPKTVYVRGQYTGKIIPITGYFLIRDCYLFIPNVAIAENNNVTATFTFFHL